MTLTTLDPIVEPNHWGASPLSGLSVLSGLRQDPSNPNPTFFHPDIQHIIDSALKPSTRKSYKAKWKRFSAFAESRSFSPILSSIQQILQFLLELHHSRLKLSSIKVYTAAIAYYRGLVDGSPLFSHPILKRFLKGRYNLNPSIRPVMPTRSLSVVLQALMKAPFETLATVDLRLFCWKTAFLVAVTSARRAKMLLLTVFLFLPAMFQQSLGEDQSAIISDLSAEAQEEILEALNSIRRNVTPPASNMLKMKWSKKASENAKKWVSQCRFRNSPQEARTTSDFACGESLAQIKIAMSWSKVIATWISTKTYFKYGIGPTDPKKNIYTYTQIVWYNSHMVGCALAYCPQNTFSFMYACHFCPGGNNQEKITTPYKEGPSCADCPQHCEDKLCRLMCGEIISQSNFIRPWLDVIQTWDNSKSRFHYGNTSADPLKMSSPYTQPPYARIPAMMAVASNWP
ncbi:Cysteine-rich venom protein 2, partial [Varanus komodoensis]